MTKTRAPGFLRIFLRAVVMLLLAVLAGCGGNGGSGGMMGGTSGMMRGGTTSSGGGRALFVSECGSCHTLAAAGTGGTAGPNLDQAAPDYGDVVEKVTNGGSTMPAFGGMLTRAEIRAIARYVSAAAGSGQ